MRAYSLDFRQKIIDVYENEAISQRGLAKRFGVAKSFIQKLLKQYRETGSLAPKQRVQQTSTKLNDEQIEVLRQLVEEKHDATLEELSASLAAKTNVKVSRSTIDRMLTKLDITVKKRPSTQTRKRLTVSSKSE